MPVFISEVKKNNTKKKNEHGDIGFFIQDLNDFLALMLFYKIDFSLKNKLRAFFRCFLCSFISQ